MKFVVKSFFFVIMTLSSARVCAEISANPITQGPFEITFVNNVGEQLNVFIRTALFDHAQASQYVHFRDGKWVYTNEPGPLETLIAPGFFSHAMAPGSTYTTKLSHAATLITVKSASAEASKSVPATFALKEVIITEDPTGLFINFK